MTIPLEKILTISAGDWCKANNSSLTNYEIKGIHFNTTEKAHFDLGRLTKAFAEKVPEDAEVVVSYRFATCRTTTNNAEHYASGTALIPKK